MKKTMQQVDIEIRAQAVAAFLVAMADIPEMSIAPSRVEMDIQFNGKEWSVDVNVHNSAGSRSGVTGEGVTLSEALRDAADLYLSEPPNTEKQ